MYTCVIIMYISDRVRESVIVRNDSDSDSAGEFRMSHLATSCGKWPQIKIGPPAGSGVSQRRVMWVDALRGAGSDA